MESAEHLVRVLSIQTRGIHVLLWEHKTDLIRALVVLKAALSNFPDTPILLPTEQIELQRFSIGLFERPEEHTPGSRRILLIPQASTQAIGAWLNGWRRQLADPPGTLLVIRRVDFVALYRRAPDLMSFAQSETHEVTGLLPLLDQATIDRTSERLPDAWYEPLNALPGALPSNDEIAGWIQRLQSHVAG
jgi:hypothetical protein